MRIGFDLDNTIIQYDQLFYALAWERGLLAPGIPAEKAAIRDSLRAAGRNHQWTELQAIAYGPELKRAKPFAGAVEYLRGLLPRHEPYLISHKTRYPCRGDRHDLHQAAREWLAAQALSGEGSPFGTSRVFLEEKLEEKLARIGQLGCQAFVDDLPEVLLHPGFPPKTQPLLFDPARRFPDEHRCRRIENWTQLAHCL